MHLNRLIASQEVNLRTLINKNQSLTSATKNSTEENESLKSALKSLEARIQFLTMWDSVPGYDSSADVVLLTPDGGRFIAHSSILSGRSIVFKAMLNSGMQESRSMVISLEDVNKEAVAIFLKFLYKAQIDAKDFQENGEVKAEMIIRLCQQYQIDFLLSTFQNFIVENIINIENLETILCIADIYELDVVKTAITQDSRWSALHAVECTYSSCISINWCYIDNGGDSPAWLTKFLFWILHGNFDWWSWNYSLQVFAALMPGQECWDHILWLKYIHFKRFAFWILFDLPSE